MKRLYRVATHGSSVSLLQGHPLWQFLGNYTPFEAEENDARGFCLMLEDEAVRLQCKGTTKPLYSFLVSDYCSIELDLSRFPINRT